MAALALVGSAVATVVLAVVVLALARGIDWRSNQIFETSEGGSLLRVVLGSPVAWTVAFLGFALGTMVLGLMVAGGLGGVAVPGGVAVGVVPFALLVLFFLVAGTYAAVRERDVSPAGATLVASLVVVGLLVIAVAGRLLMGP